MSNPLAITPSIAAQWKQQRFNPLRTVTPATLGSLIDQYDAGYLRGFALAAEQIMERDDTLAAVVPKRKKRVSRRPWDVLIGEDVPDELKAEAERHQAALKYFYSRLKVRNAVEKNEQGGVKLLVRKMMTAQFMRYAAAEIEWQPGPQGMAATLHYVPVEFLESSTGILRFAGVSGSTPGAEMDESNWLIAVADACIMKSAAVCYMFKRLSLADWLNLSGKFGIPGIHGETDAKKGTPEWDAFIAMLSAFANDWVAATSAGSKINIIEAGVSGESPFAPMVDRMDRALARLCMGGDLSTLSREDGVGANPQSQEADELITDDCEWMSELFNEQLDRRVIEWQFGAGTDPLAFFKLMPPQRQDTKMEMEVDNHVKKHGVVLSPEDVAERYSRTLSKAQPETPEEPEAPDPEAEPSANERRPNFGDGRVVPAAQALKDKKTILLKKLSKGVQADLKPAVDALLTLENADGPDALRSAVMGLDLPTIEKAVMAGSAANEAFEVTLAAEFLAGLASIRN
ncbi:phage portal protein family protein [Prosthecobacter algae]|uniref:phage portal protein family protein n=1 Tax=Prosthecobacter algae TaxID=1144682 RepID=UPI0031F145B3